MCRDLNDIEQARHDFACQGILERRKTQYTLLLSYLAGAGAAVGFVLGAQYPEDKLLILLVPIVLQIPIYFWWWYQRKQIYRLDATRRTILRLPDTQEEMWQTRAGEWSVDVVILAIPFALVALGWIAVTGTQPPPSRTLWINFVGACCATIVNLLIAVTSHMQRSRWNVQRRKEIA